MALTFCTNNKLLWHVTIPFGLLLLRVYEPKGRFFWTLPISAHSSYVWRTILKHRDTTRHYTKHVIGDGKCSFLWHDDWHPVGLLVTMHDSSLRFQWKVSNVTHDSCWCWPARSEALLETREGLCESSQPNSLFLIELFGLLLPRGVLVWAGLGVHSMLNSLATKDRLFKWNMQVNPFCCLCNSANEDRNHLCFAVMFLLRCLEVYLACLGCRLSCHGLPVPTVYGLQGTNVCITLLLLLILILVYSWFSGPLQKD